MKDMMSVYQEINKRRQSEEMDVNSLTMFAEAWEYQKRIIDEQQKRIDKLRKNIEDIYDLSDETNICLVLDRMQELLK